MKRFGLLIIGSVLLIATAAYASRHRHHTSGDPCAVIVTGVEACHAAVTCTPSATANVFGAESATIGLDTGMSLFMPQGITFTPSGFASGEQITMQACYHFGGLATDYCNQMQGNANDPSPFTFDIEPASAFQQDIVSNEPLQTIGFKCASSINSTGATVAIDVATLEK